MAFDFFPQQSPDFALGREGLGKGKTVERASLGLAESRASGISKQKLGSPRDTEQWKAEGSFVQNQAVLLSHVRVA